MRLKELADATGTTTASLKFYLREGLLFPGESVHATRADYGQAHVDRVEMIRALRTVVGLGIPQVKGIVRAVETGPPLDALGHVQAVVMGIEGAPAVRSDLGQSISDRHGWPAAGTESRNALDAHLESMRALGLEPDPETLETYAAAADLVASRDLEGSLEAGAGGSVDRMVAFAATGMYLYSQLLLKLLAVAQAGQAVRRLSPRQTDEPGPPDPDRGGRHG